MDFGILLACLVSQCLAFFLLLDCTVSFLDFEKTKYCHRGLVPLVLCIFSLINGICPCDYIYGLESSLKRFNASKNSIS